MDEWKKEQLITIEVIRDGLIRLEPAELDDLKGMIAPYMGFRQKLDQFMLSHFSRICTNRCFTGKLSACCQKDAVIIFFSDMVINLIGSTPDQTEDFYNYAKRNEDNDRCLYLAENGCSWKVRPIICAMFLCPEAEKKVLEKDSAAMAEWKDLLRMKEGFTWPDRPVLFEEIERIFIKMKISSPLMHYHRSPGLVRIRKMREAIDNG